MSGSTNFSDRAFEFLIKKEIQRIHPKFSPKCIIRSDLGHVTVSFLAEEICGPLVPTEKGLLPALKLYGSLVAVASWQISQPTLTDFPLTQETFEDASMPKPDEMVIIRGEVKLSMDRNPKLQFLLTVSRRVPHSTDKVHVIIGKGFATLMANQHTAATRRPSPHISYYEPSVNWGVPPQSPSSSAPATKRVASQDDSEPTTSTKKAAPPPVLRSLPSLIAAFSIGQQPSTSAAAQVTPTPATNPPALTLSVTPAPTQVPRSIKSNPRLSGVSNNWKQRFMYCNVRARAKYDYCQLMKILKGWGIFPVCVEYEEMFLGEKPTTIYYFDVGFPKEEEKIREKLVKEEEWTSRYCLDNMAKNKPFFAETLQLGELFQTVLVATRLNKPNVQQYDRQEMVWRESEVRKALRSDRVMKIEELLNDKGKQLMALYKKELLGV
ncbi:unnamed protein product [Caenorhabditis nigoni]